MIIERLEVITKDHTVIAKSALSGLKASVRKGSGSCSHILTVTTNQKEEAITRLLQVGFCLEWNRSYTNKVDFVVKD